MTTRFQNFLKFQVERFILRGTFYRLLFIAAAIVMVSVCGGLLAFWATTGFSTSGEAVWWAFLRLTDPGYLGDDEGQFKRVISTILTVLGYVLFMGALIATLTQWLQETISRLQSGLTPIVIKNHFLILGWSDRTPAMVHQILLSEGRVKRFLNRLGERKLHLVILAEDVNPSLVQALRDEMGSLYDPNQITFRSGNPLKVEHLRRVDFLRAAAIMLPLHQSSDANESSPDGRAMKTLLSAVNSKSEKDPIGLPLMVVEIQNSRNARIAEHIYEGPIETLAIDQILSRVIAQSVRNPGLSWVLANSILTNKSNQIFVRECSILAGQSFDRATRLFPEAILLGVTQKTPTGYHPVINPPLDFTLSAADHLVFLAPRFQNTQPITTAPPEREPAMPLSSESSVTKPASSRNRRVLALGWNHKAMGLLQEFESYGNEDFELEMISMLSIEERQRQMQHEGIHPSRVKVRHHVADYTSQNELKQFNPASFDNIVILANNRLDSDAESEARITLGYLVLKEILNDSKASPHIVVELMSRENLGLFHANGDEVIVTPLLLSNILTQVALRRDLNSVFELLFGPNGPEILFVPFSQMGLTGKSLAFETLQETCLSRQEIALGYRKNKQKNELGGGITLNPDRNLALELDSADEVIVIRHPENPATGA